MPSASMVVFTKAIVAFTTGVTTNLYYQDWLNNGESRSLRIMINFTKGKHCI